MWEGYMQLAGVEIVNSARATALAAAAGLRINCEPCDTVAAALGHVPYYAVDQEENPAPWYDPARPESRQFLGVLGLGVTGFATPPVERQTTALVGDGSALGVLRQAHREIVFSVLLLYQGECALSYALGWLARALRGSVCDTDGCTGDELCLFSCCPGDTPTTPGDLGEAELRHLFDVGLAGAPTLGEYKDLPGGVKAVEYQFTLAAGKPWIYGEPLPEPTGWVQLTDGRHLHADPDAVYDNCREPAPCAQDPLCPPPPMPPQPPAPVSPCYPTGVDDFWQNILKVDAATAPQWMDLVPLIEVRTGATEMRRLVISFWQNLQNMPCEEISDPCQVCFSVVVPHVPAASALTIDGRTRRVTVECPRGLVGTARTELEVYGQQGGRFSWPVLECASGVCIEVMSLMAYTASDAQARVQLIPRQDAA